MQDIWFDKERTKRRLQALEQYAKDKHITYEDFRCSSLESCNSSLRPGLSLLPDNRGGLAYVGEDYDTVAGAQELRIVFVGYDYGRGHANLIDRQTEIQDYAGKLNPHYKGIVKCLIEIYQDGCEQEWKHLLRRMAQTNATRCAAPMENRMRSNTTPCMRTNCWPHFKKEIEVLEPTIIWFHGAELKSSFLRALQADGLSPSICFDGDNQCQEVEWAIFEKPFKSLLVFFHHPAHGCFGDQWDDVTVLIARLRETGHLPTFEREWTPRERKTWPAI